MVRFEKVSFRYGSGTPVLDDLSFHLEPGSFHFVLGASGAGKSSLLQLMYLWQRQSSGRISLFGRDVGQLTRHEKAMMRRRIGVVFQDFRLLDHLTTLENVALPLRVAGRHRPSLDEHTAELLSWVGLGNYLHNYPPTLSGGQQQRVAIARAVIARPSLLLADEPTGNMDERLALRLLYLFEELNKMGTTVVIATHNESLAKQFRQPTIRLTGGDSLLPGDSPRDAKARR